MGLKPFYDTNVLLGHLDVVDQGGSFYLSSVTLIELEEIKTSARKTEDVRYAARRAVEWLDKHEDKYKIIIYEEGYEDYLLGEYRDHPLNDFKIVACAVGVNAEECRIKFVSDDILARLIASMSFGLVVEKPTIVSDSKYTGFKEIMPNAEELNLITGEATVNRYNCLTNEYLIALEPDGEVADIFKWTGVKYEQLAKRLTKPMRSSFFGDKIKPKDAYQTCMVDSILNNTMTAISGKAGSGKSLLSLYCIMSLIENGSYDRLIIMFNPTKARGASDMGYYSGNATEKAMQNSIGSMLTTKFGDRYMVDNLIAQDKLRLVSMADIRGMEVRDNEILYITEAQNTSVDLLKLCLSRASSGCKIVIEGDFNSQVDSYMFDGNANGMRCVIDAFKGEDIFGYVELQNVWRSKIATLADRL